jgi:KAP family P-loop domain
MATRASNPDLRDSIFLGSTGDSPASLDTLGFKAYVESVARFLESRSTRPPLTTSIEGEWGTGKSSFMKQLQKRLCGVSRMAFKENVAAQRIGGSKCSAGLGRSLSNLDNQTHADSN